MPRHRAAREVLPEVARQREGRLSSGGAALPEELHERAWGAGGAGRRAGAQGGGAAETPGAGNAGAYTSGSQNPAYDGKAGATVAADDSNAL